MDVANGKSVKRESLPVSGSLRNQPQAEQEEGAGFRHRQQASRNNIAENARVGGRRAALGGDVTEGHRVGEVGVESIPRGPLARRAKHQRPEVYILA